MLRRWFCIHTFTKCALVVPVQGKSENDLALGMIEPIVNMGKKPLLIYTDGETGTRNSGLFQKRFNDNQITVHYTRGHSAFVERFLGTFKAMLDRRIAPGQDWTQLIYLILITYHNKLMNSAIEMTPKEATKPENELNVYVNLELKAKDSRRYLILSVGDKVRI